jgi:hypothetical protein
MGSAAILKGEVPRDPVCSSTKSMNTYSNLMMSLRRYASSVVGSAEADRN